MDTVYTVVLVHQGDICFRFNALSEYLLGLRDLDPDPNVRAYRSGTEFLDRKFSSVFM
jgi:hypothetical protein